MARNDVYLNINALSPADAVVTGQQDMTAATVPELVLGDTPTFNFYFTDNTNVWPSWAGNASYTLTWALSDAVAGDFSPAATTGNATPITGGWSVLLPLNSYDLVGLLNTKRVSQPYPVTNLWQQLRVTDPSGNEVTRAMFWTPVRYRAISDTQNTESASPTGGRFVAVNNLNALTTPTSAQFYSANPVPTSALGTASNGELLIGNGTGFTKATLTAGSGVSITNGSGSITISATDGDITLDDGTAAAPSLKFTADTDTGIYRPSDNVLGISAGGVSRATFGATSAINGTTIPGSKTLVVTTDKLSALAATTSAELAGVISDETGTGALVFANTPTLVTPNIGAATGTSFNLTGSGTLGTTLTVNGTTDSSSKDTGAIITEGGLGVEKSASIGGNLTVSGTALSSVAGALNVTGALLVHQTAALNMAHEGSSLSQLVSYGADASTYGRLNVILRKAGTGVGAVTALALTSTDATLAGNLTVSGGTTTSGVAKVGTGLVSWAEFSHSGAFGTSNYCLLQNSSGGTYLNAVAGQNVYFAIGNTIHGNLTSTGSFLFGTTTNSGNGRLQLATHSDSTGGIALGTSLSVYSDSANRFCVVGGTTTRFRLFSTSGNAAELGFDNSELYAQSTTQIRFVTNNTTALTLDSSQRCILAGALRLNNAYTAGAPTATGYVTIQDSAGNTYKVLVGT